MKINRDKITPEQFLTWIGPREFTTQDLANRCQIDSYDAEMIMRSLTRKNRVKFRAQRGNGRISLFTVAGAAP